MKQYLDLGVKILTLGRHKPNRTGVGTVGIFGEQIRFDLQKGYPLVTTKHTIFKPMIRELVWFLEGSTDNKRLNELGAKFWDAWALKEDVPSDKIEDIEQAIKDFTELENDLDDHAKNSLLIQLSEQVSIHKDNLKAIIPFMVENGIKIKPKMEAGELGPIYGKQWRDFGGVDQIKVLIDGLKNKPFSRRHIVSAWNPPELADDTVDPQQNIKNGKMALSPCHCLFQYYVEEANFEERSMYFHNKFFRHEIRADDITLINRIFASEHVKNFVNMEENYKEENKVSELPRERILAFCFNNKIPVTVYKVVKTYIDRISFLENFIDMKSFQEMISKYQQISSQHVNPHSESFLKAVRELLDSYEAPECVDDVATMQELSGLTNKEVFVDYYTSIFDKHNVPKYRLSCQLYQRSCDFPVGIPVNIASYSLLTIMVAQVVDMIPGDFVHTFGDVHVYDNQVEKFREQLNRIPYQLPEVYLNPEVKDIFAFKESDFKLMNYFHHPKIEYPVAV